MSEAHHIVHVRTPKALVGRFHKAMPGRGSLSWFVRSALEMFLDELEPPAGTARRVSQRLAQTEQRKRQAVERLD